MNGSAIALSLLTAFFWGVGAFFDKLSLNILPPKVVFIARLYLLFILLLAPMVLNWDESRLAILRSDKRAIWYLLGTVVFMYAGMYAYYHALSLDSAARVVPLCAVYPFIAFLFAAFILKEPFTLGHASGAALIALGAFLVSRP